MRVLCHLDERVLEGDYGSVDGVVVTCTRCEVEMESFGTSPASVRRCFALLREQCDEDNFYYTDDEDNE